MGKGNEEIGMRKWEIGKAMRIGAPAHRAIVSIVSVACLALYTKLSKKICTIQIITLLLHTY